MGKWGTLEDLESQKFRQWLEKLQKSCPVELSEITNEILHIWANMVATSYVWLLSIWNIASVAKELNFKFHLILSNLKVNSHIWLLATILDSTAIEAPMNGPQT